MEHRRQTPRASTRRLTGTLRLAGTPRLASTPRLRKIGKHD